MIRSLLTLALSLFSYSVIALEINPDAPIPESNNVYKTSLSNGVCVYIQEHPSDTLWGSFKVVFSGPFPGNNLYTFDSKASEWDSLNEFFLDCTNLTEPLPTEIAVIAVGNFSSSEMLKLIENHFEKMDLADSNKNPTTSINYSDELDHVAINITLPSKYGAIETFADLKECWKSLFLQELLQQRFEECTRGIGEIWVHPHPQNFFPVPGFALVCENEAENTLAFLLWNLEMIKIQGFYADSFATKKNHILHKLHYLTSTGNNPDATFLSSYYKDQFLLGHYCYNHIDFLNASLDLVQEIQFEDLLPLLNPFMDKHNRHIQLVYPGKFRLTPLTEERIEQLKNHIEHLAQLQEAQDRIDTIPVRKTPNGTDLVYYVNNDTTPVFCLANNSPDLTSSFYQLPLSQKEMALIDSIISTMANDNLIQLALNKRAIEKKGKKIEHVHPLRFMGYILSHRSLKDNIRTVKKSSFKWDAFIDGFSKRMREELSKNNVYPHLDGFAQLVGSTPEHITPYIHKRDFEGLVKSLL